MQKLFNIIFYAIMVIIIILWPAKFLGFPIWVLAILCFLWLYVGGMVWGIIKTVISELMWIALVLWYAFQPSQTWFSIVSYMLFVVATYINIKNIRTAKKMLGE